MMKIRHWISESWNKLHWFCVNWASETVRVLELFLMNFALILTAKRENVDSVSDVALILTLYPIYKLPCVPVSQWPCDTWTGLNLAWPWTESEKGLKCNFGKFGTVLQLKIWTILKVKKKKWADLKIKRYLDCLEN